MPQHWHHQNGELVENTSMKGLLAKLKSETFILDLAAKSPLPKLDGYHSRLTDTSTLEVEVMREQGLNGLFAQLSAQGVQVLSMRNKANRTEELFVTTVNGNGEKHDAFVLGGLTEHLGQRVNRFARIWIQTTVPPVITMTLYFIIFGNLIGSRIGDMHGFSYMQFIVPGLIMMAVITNSYANVASSFFSAKFQRNIEELLVAPVPTHVVIAGYVGGGVARGICVGVLVTIISLFFVPLQVHARWVIALTLLLTAILFSLAGLINAVFATTFDDISLIPTFVLTPLTYGRGVLFAVVAATILAGGVQAEPHRLYDQRFPLRFPRHQRRAVGVYHGGAGGVYRGVLSAVTVSDRGAAAVCAADRIAPSLSRRGRFLVGAGGA